MTASSEEIKGIDVAVDSDGSTMHVEVRGIRLSRVDWARQPLGAMQNCNQLLAPWTSSSSAGPCGALIGPSRRLAIPASRLARASLAARRATR